jgi:hypothetical protein
MRMLSTLRAVGSYVAASATICDFIRHRDLLGAVQMVMFGAGKGTGLALQIGKDAILPFALKAFEMPTKISFVVYDVVSPSLSAGLPLILGGDDGSFVLSTHPSSRREIDLNLADVLPVRDRPYRLLLLRVVVDLSPGLPGVIAGGSDERPALHFHFAWRSYIFWSI